VTAGTGSIVKADDIDRQRVTGIIFADDPLPSRDVLEARLGAKLEHRRTFEAYEIFGLHASGASGFDFEMTINGATTSGLRMQLPGTGWGQAACITPKELQSRLIERGWGSPGVTEVARFI
jgi:hypothetical protein